MSSLKKDEDLLSRAKSWAFRTNSVIAYPVVKKGNDTYSTTRTNESGKKRSISKQKVFIEVKIGNSTHLGKHLYDQESQLTDKINEIYLHYYLKSHPYED